MSNSNEDRLGESLSILAVTIANAFTRGASKEDIFVLAAFLSAIAANLYVIANSRLTFPLQESGEAETGI